MYSLSNQILCSSEFYIFTYKLFLANEILYSKNKSINDYKDYDSNSEVTNVRNNQHQSRTLEREKRASSDIGYYLEFKKNEMVPKSSKHRKSKSRHKFKTTTIKDLVDEKMSKVKSISDDRINANNTFEVTQRPIMMQYDNRLDNAFNTKTMNKNLKIQKDLINDVSSNEPSHTSFINDMSKYTERQPEFDSDHEKMLKDENRNFKLYDKDSKENTNSQFEIIEKDNEENTDPNCIDNHSQSGASPTAILNNTHHSIEASINTSKPTSPKCNSNASKFTYEKPPLTAHTTKLQMPPTKFMPNQASPLYNSKSTSLKPCLNMEN